MKLDKLPDFIKNDINLLAKFNIDTNIELAHFLSQVHHESGGFKFKVENLNYSDAGLLKIFGKYFTTDTAKQYARKPQNIANRVYANRMGNGDEKSGEGWKYRGRGYIQLTGKNNYSALNSYLKTIGLADNVLASPDLVETKYPLLSAAYWWMVNGLNQIADDGAAESVVKAVTKRVNGGLNGYAHRLEMFKYYFDLLKNK
jgi:putative chitinase